MEQGGAGTVLQPTTRGPSTHIQLCFQGALLWSIFTYGWQVGLYEAGFCRSRFFSCVGSFMGSLGFSAAADGSSQGGGTSESPRCVITPQTNKLSIAWGSDWRALLRFTLFTHTLFPSIQLAEQKRALRQECCYKWSHPVGECRIICLCCVPVEEITVWICHLFSHSEQIFCLSVLAHISIVIIPLPVTMFSAKVDSIFTVYVLNWNLSQSTRTISRNLLIFFIF